MLPNLIRIFPSPLPLGRHLTQQISGCPFDIIDLNFALADHVSSGYAIRYVHTLTEDRAPLLL